VDFKCASLAKAESRPLATIPKIPKTSATFQQITHYDEGTSQPPAARTLILFPANLSLPAPVFWGSLAAWIPLPPAVMAGILCATMIYAVLHHLWNVKGWLDEQESDDPLLPINYLNVKQTKTGVCA